MASRTVHHRQKALAQLHRTRTEVVSASTGQPGMTLLRALRTGARASQRWATSRETRCQHDHATSAKALTGPWRPAPLCAWPQAVDQDDVLAPQ
jgi:hypothetical protein